jgi:microcystin degradation protein MlrC
VLWAGIKAFPITGPLKTGSLMDLGPTALLDAGGILISVVSVQWSAIDLDCFHQFGLKPKDFSFILLRSKTHFREVYTPLAETIIIIDTPDWGPADLKTLPYRNIPPGVFPVTEP